MKTSTMIYPATTYAGYEEQNKERLRRAHQRGVNATNEAPLTNYKKDVDIFKKYGVSKSDLVSVKLKIRKQENFLKYSYVKNNSTGQAIPLQDCIISSNHNTSRYYAEIQNRIDTLQREAEQGNLTPVFLTITLPSEFHKMKQDKKTKQLIKNPKYNNIEPKEAVKVITKMWAKLRHDRSLKELSKNERMYYRVNEPHKDGTPHAHFLLFIPKDKIERVEKSFNRLYNPKTNKFVKDIENAKSYIMKYINKTLPKAKDELTQDDEYLNAWYIKNRINRFCSSRSTAPMYLYRLLHHRYSLYALTQVRKGNSLQVLARLEDDKIMEIWDDGELLFMRSEDIEIHTIKGLAA
ncbi:replication endonuclease [Sulfurimonas lithotrophica]|uniref:Replication endonuclease n=1 Tax=Sulfurimonas lithotrophica TaxID=2590022 RepID=A0A5P8P2A0_9BACT|nr:replication endonuclease [Sulfurimonas lithotrophica]QFR49863.1 replication endonuclease [Sulfurimonas lithotrophica]